MVAAAGDVDAEIEQAGAIGLRRDRVDARAVGARPRLHDLRPPHALNASRWCSQPEVGIELVAHERRELCAVGIRTVAVEGQIAARQLRREALGGQVTALDRRGRSGRRVRRRDREACARCEPGGGGRVQHPPRQPGGHTRCAASSEG